MTTTPDIVEVPDPLGLRVIGMTTQPDGTITIGHWPDGSTWTPLATLHHKPGAWTTQPHTPDPYRPGTPPPRGSVRIDRDSDHPRIHVTCRHCGWRYVASCVTDATDHKKWHTCR